jgi:glycine/D-amino acid oxidase-like deaminating enzyme
MVAPRSPEFRLGVLWHDRATPPALTPYPLPAEADVVVVGGGYGGMAAARRLSAAGRHTVVVEADPVGTGASTRNGGMVIPELKAGPIALERAYGPLGTRMFAEVNEAFEHTEALIADEGIDCDYVRSGQLYLAHNEGKVAVLRHLAREHDLAGEEVRFVGREGLEAEIGSTAFPAGLVMPRTGGLDPARFHAGLTRLALDAGAEIHERTRAVSLRPGPSGRTRVLTDRGAVDAGDVIVATNATADDLLASVRRRVLPMGSFIIATEVLEPALLDAVTPTRRMMVDTKNLLFYWRATPDGRIAFGGRRSLAPTTVDQAADFLYDAMVRLHPMLAGTLVDRAWGGSVALTLDRMPHVGRSEGAWYLTGCNGSGVALMTWLGHAVAGTVLGERPPPSFTELRFTPIPLERYRRQWLPIAGKWFQWEDRRG